MVNIFEINDKTNRKIRLTDNSWKHISTEHPYINLEEIQRALQKPTTIKSSKYKDDVCWYYLFNKILKKYLLVSVRYLNGEGFIITAFYVRNLK